MAMTARSCFLYVLLLAILVIVIAQLLLYLTGWGPNKSNLAREENHEQKLLSRDEFKYMIMGKTEEEVLAAAGRPRTTSQEDSMSYWHYAKRTKDALTGQADSDVQVVFQHGRVVAVNY
jgi:outer membrane protein assembly factor BamE (lipoprotein component of BamABCDE complex)